MGILTVLSIGVGLSMDAFAVSLTKGLAAKKLRPGYILKIALAFGLFQAGMPVIGWLLGSYLNEQVQAFGAWVAFAVLLAIGGKMIYDAMHPEKEESGNAQEQVDDIGWKVLFILAVATSIDAFAVGTSMALTGVNTWGAILQNASIIGITTFLFSGVGVYLGKRFGLLLKSKGEIAGGIILILIGLKILIEHLIERSAGTI